MAHNVCCKDKTHSSFKPSLFISSGGICVSDTEDINPSFLDY